MRSIFAIAASMSLSAVAWSNGLARENINLLRAAAQSSASSAAKSSGVLLSPRTVAVNIHCAVGGRNCRDTIASLRDTRATHHNVTNFFCWRGRQWLRRQHYHVLARIISECRYAEREGEDPDCKSDRPAAPATQSGSSSHAVILNPLRI
jgi:hypothetical protein